MSRFVVNEGWNISRMLATMSAKSLGTLPVIYAIDEVQSPLPRKTMLFEGHMTSTFGRSDAFSNS